MAANNRCWRSLIVATNIFYVRLLTDLKQLVIKSPEWNFGGLWLQRVLLQPTITTYTIYNNLCWVLIYMFITNWHVNQYWDWYDKTNHFNFDIYCHEEIMILTPKTAVKWSPRDHIQMLALRNG